MSNESLDEEAGKHAVAPRVTLEHIESLIDYTMFINPGHILLTDDNYELPKDSLSDSVSALSCLTICVIALKNGFTVTGESACAAPENFNRELGEKIARENAVKKIWMLEGYLLRNELSKGT